MEEPMVFEVLEVADIRYKNITDLKGATLEIVSFGEGENKISYLLFNKKIYIKEFNKELIYIYLLQIYIT